jgi:hypothetical protein
MIICQYFHLGYKEKEKWKYIHKKPLPAMREVRKSAWKALGSCCANTARIPRQPEHANIMKASECRTSVVEVLPAFALLTKFHASGAYYDKKLHDNVMFFVTGVKLMCGYSTKAIPEVWIRIYIC